MYRIHFLNNTWYCAALEEETLSQTIDNDVDDIEDIVKSVDEGTPTMLVKNLCSLPTEIKQDLVEIE